MNWPRELTGQRFRLRRVLRRHGLRLIEPGARARMRWASEPRRGRAVRPSQFLQRLRCGLLGKRWWPTRCPYCDEFGPADGHPECEEGEAELAEYWRQEAALYAEEWEADWEAD